MVTFKRIFIGAGTVLTSLFAIFFAVGLQITDVSGDIKCEGTLENPCISIFRISNPTPRHVDIYNKEEEVRVDFVPTIKDSLLFIEDKRATGKLTGSSYSCYLKDGTEIALKGWRCLDFTNRTKPSKDRVYVHRIPAYSLGKKYLLYGLKNNPEQIVKWTFGTAQDELDPEWGTNYKTLCRTKTITEEYYETELKKVDIISCADEPTNQSCTIKKFDALVNSKKSRVVDECVEKTGINITIANKEKTYKLSDGFGYYVKGDIVTCIPRINGYSENRAENLKDKCLVGEYGCTRFNLTTGKIIDKVGGYDGCTI